MAQTFMEHWFDLWMLGAACILIAAVFAFMAGILMMLRRHD